MGALSRLGFDAAGNIVQRTGPRLIEQNVTGPVMSFLGQVGRTLDIGTGAAFLRNVIGGEFDKALLTVPGVGFFTAPDRDYAVSGRDLVTPIFDAIGLPKISASAVFPFAFGAPGSGSLIEKEGFFDITARGTAGFITEMALDPATYVGIGALTRTGKAIRLAGRTKSDVLKTLADAAIPSKFAKMAPALKKAIPIVQDIAAKGGDIFLQPTWAQQVAAGQRSLLAVSVPFNKLGGPRIPIPFLDIDKEVKIFQSISRFGKFVRRGPIGKLFLNKPGSSTGIVPYNDLTKILANILKGAEALEGAQANQILADIYNIAKSLPDDVVKKTPEGLGNFAKGVLFAEEMTDAMKALPKVARERVENVINTLRQINDEILLKEIRAGVSISRLGEAAANKIDDLGKQLKALRESGQEELADLIVDKYAQSQRKIEGIEELIRREDRLGIAKAERQLGKTIRSIEEKVERIGDAPLGEVPLAEMQGQITGMEQGLRQLDGQWISAQKRWLNQADESKRLGQKTQAMANAETEISVIDRSIQRQRRILDQTAERLAKKERTGLLRSLNRGIKLIEKAEVQSAAFKKVRDGIKGLDELADVPGIDRAILNEVLQQVADRTKYLRQILKTESGRLVKIDRSAQRMLLEIDPSLSNIPEALRPELYKEFPEVAEGLITELKQPSILKDVGLKARRINAMAGRIKSEIDDLSVTASQTDYYVSHIVTQEGREYLERQFPGRFQGAGTLWTPAHGSTMKRMIPFDIQTVNEKMSSVLNGKEFFETNPGIVLFTRSMRAKRSETMFNYAKGLTQLDGISVNIERAIAKAVESGTTRRLRVREIVGGVKGDVDFDKLGKLVSRVVTRKVGKRAISEAQWLDDLDELDGLLLNSGTDLRIPQNKRIRELWFRKGIDPVAIPEEIAFDTALIGDVFSGEGEIVKGFIKMVAAWTRPWKAFTLFPWPAYHTRNFYSEHFLNVIQGMTNPIVYAKHAWNAAWLNMMDVKRSAAFKKAKAFESAGKIEDATRLFAEHRRLEKALANRKFNTRFGEVNGIDILEQYRINGLDDGYSRQARELLNPVDAIRRRSELGKEMRKASKEPGIHGTLGKAAGSIVEDLKDPFAAFAVGRKFEDVLGKIADVTSVWTEKHPRMTQYLWELETQGRAFDDAALEVVKRHYDYSSGAFTGFENKLRATLIPFYSWQRQNAPMMIKEFLGTPRRTTAILRLTDQQFTPEEVQSMPDWIRESVKIRVGKDQVIHRIGLPFEDILEWANDPVRKAVLSIHPVGQEAIRSATGIDPFLKRKPEPFLGSDFGPLPAPLEIPLRTFAGRVQTVLRQTGQLRRGELDVGTAISGFTTGLKPRPFDPSRARLEQLRDQVRELINSGRAREAQIPFVPRNREDNEARAIISEFSSLSRQAAAERRAEEEGEEAQPRRRRRRRRRARRQRRGAE